MKREIDMRGFPPGFLWGAATSGYQIEGAPSADGKGPSIWDVFAHRPGKTLHGDTGDIACGAYDRERLNGDLDLLRDLGATAYIFSVQWPRVQPDGRGAVCEAGVDYYRFLVDGLRARGIEPFATLYHWELPQALQRAGGWRNRATAARFADYATLVQQRLGDRVRFWITQNEPHSTTWLGHVAGTHAPGLRDLGLVPVVAHHLLLSHGWAAQALRAADPGSYIGLVVDASPYRPASESAADRAAAAQLDGDQNRLFFDPLFRGAYPEDVLQRHADAKPGFAAVRAGDLEAIRGQLDFLGVNYYAPRYVRAAGAGPEVIAPPGPSTANGWAIDPEGLIEALRRLRRDYTGELPVLISENGMSCRDYLDPNGACIDSERVDFLKSHIDAARRAIADGVPLKGYFVWSLLDNFEWDNGYRERFGLVHVDYATQTRTPKASYRWLQQLIRDPVLP